MLLDFQIVKRSRNLDFCVKSLDASFLAMNAKKIFNAMRVQMVEAKQSKILSVTSEPEGPLRETDGWGVWAVLTQLDNWKGGKT